MNDSAENNGSPWLLWQVIDSAFPVGGFAHSGGLEAALRLGEIESAEDLERYLRMSLGQSAAFACPSVIEAAREPARFAELDALHDAMLANAVANRASRATGTAVLVAGEAILGGDSLADARRLVRKGESAGHLPPAFGLLANRLGLDGKGAADVFLFQQGRATCSAAVRLGAVGPTQAQRLQLAAAAWRPALLETAFNTPADAAAQTAPMIDLLQGLHDKLYSRLFAS